jgi:glycosyltransferase involved in cell wall biosynthesis
MISVIIPTYNRASFLKEAIQSVLDQDYFSDSFASHLFELIIIDDGSTDRTKEVVESFGDRISYHYQEHKGVSAARNHGLQLARGAYIAFLDSDDLWKKEKMQIQMSFMQAFPQANVCYTEEIWMRRGVRVNPLKKHQKYSGWIFDKVLPLCLLSLSSTLFRREIFEEIGNFDEDLPVCEDYDLGIRIARKYPIYFISNSLIIKRGGHPDQLSKKYWGMDRYRVQALEKALSLGLTPEQELLVKKEIVKKGRVLINGFRKRGNQAEAERYSKLISRVHERSS